MPRAVAAFAVAAGTLVPAAAQAAADKEHKLLMAEIRMLQEEQQQPRQTLAGLNDTLKAINARLDQDASRNQKAFADQKLVIENVAETSRVLREKADETNVRLSSMTQELQSLRQTVASMPAPSALVPAQPGDPAPSPILRRRQRRQRRRRATSSPNVSPTQLWIACMRSTPPASSTWRSKASSRRTRLLDVADGR